MAMMRMRWFDERMLCLCFAGLILASAERSVPAADVAVARSVESIDKTAQAGPFQPTWDSLKEYQVPDWYQDAKFGVLIHWGVYCVPAFGNE